MRRKITLAVAAAMSLAAATPGLAKGSNQGTVTLVTTAPYVYGETITIAWSTLQPQPGLIVGCFQPTVKNGTRVLHEGFFASPSTVTLATSTWTGGAAKCYAELYAIEPHGAKVLQTVYFDVGP